MKEKEYQKSILIGNGFNRAFSLGSWGNIIEDIAVKNGNGDKLELINKLPFPMQIVVASNDAVDACMNDLAKEFSQVEVCDEQSSLMKRIVDMPFSCVMTSNYSYEIERSILGKYSQGDYRKTRKLSRSVNSAEKQSMLYQFTDFSFYRQGLPTICHIHGEAFYPSSMVMGHYYYGKLLRMIENYIPEMLREYHKSISEGYGYEYKSWVDHYMLDDLYILGFGMDLSESDLWWLLCCKKRHFPQRKTTLFMPKKDIAEEKKLLLETYGVKIIADKAKDYKEYYRKTIDEIDKMIR